MLKNINIAVLFITMIFCGCAGPTTKTIKPSDAAVVLEADKQKEIAIKELIKSHERLQNVGWPILKAGLPFCVDRKYWSSGFNAINKYDFSDNARDVAVSSLGVSDVLQVVFVNESSPADSAGLQKGDLLIAINGKDAPVAKDATKRLGELVREETKDGKDLTIKIKRNGDNEIINIDPVETCDYPIVLIDDPNVNAFADGNVIGINQGMMDFARTDDELALVIGHELAHNNMRHIDSKRINAMGGLIFDILAAALGVNTQGAFTKMAANAYSQEFEAEADYVGLYILAIAGNDISEAQYFWRRMGVKHPGSIDKNHAAAHPSSPERFVAIEETVKEIQMKIAANEPLTPNIDEDKLTSREPPPSPASRLGIGP